MTNKALIQVVEDDAPVRSLITVTLRAHDYRFVTAENGETAVMQTASQKPDIMLLDLGLPDIDGVEVIKRVRSWSSLPIIVISARSDDEDKVEALDAGADDYLTKPFSVEELMARIRVAQRRLSAGMEQGGEPIFVNGPLTVDYLSGCAYLSGNPLKLTPIEYKLLCLLCRNAGRVLTHNYITQHIWGGSWESYIGSLRVFMATLRKKLENFSGTQFIQTHINVGYRMVKIDHTEQE